MQFYHIIVKHNQKVDIKNVGYFAVNNQKFIETVSVRPAGSKEDQSYPQSKRWVCNIET